MRRCSSLILRRSVTPQCLPFELSRSDALKHFADWAKVHDAANASVLGGVWQAQDGILADAHAVK